MATTISQLTQASASEITSDAQLIWQTKDGNTRRVPWSDVNTTLGGARYTATLDVSSAEILALNTTPIELVAAPGSGKVVKIQSIVANLTFGTAAFATNTNLQIITSGASVAQYELDMLGATVSTIRQMKDNTTSNVAHTQLLDNTAVNVMAETGDPTTGDGTVTIYATYDIITL
jgi:hypothetical protein